MTSAGNPPSEYARRGLDDLQLGHLRHFDNLSLRLDNDWSLMQGKGFGQDDFGGYRFQLAYMTYALALTHQHRLPNAPGVFRPMLERIMQKMLLPEVWSYWHDVSRGGSVYNAHLGPLSEKWDPVAQDNIMYSAYVQSMALLHHYLFRDDRYAQSEALSMEHWSFFWGGESRRFDYDENSLNEHIYWQMVSNGYIGVACEPNCVFQICNQPAILGFRLHDVVNGGSRAQEVVREYENAWASLGRLGENGHYNTLVATDSRKVFENALIMPWVDAWNGTLMNMWNRDFVHEHYPSQIRDILVPGEHGALSIRPTPPRQLMGQTLKYDWGDFGWTAAWASEMGDADTLAGLLTHADRYMHPLWADGGLHYPRNDTSVDAAGNLTLMDPITGNVLLAYARLNVPDGLHRLYAEPWDDAHFREPMVTEVRGEVIVRVAYFDAGTKTLHVEATTAKDRHGSQFQVSNLGETAVLAADGGEASLSDATALADLGARVVDGDLIVDVRSGGWHSYAVRLQTG
ncbi:hypothetical protein [Cryobacterium sp. SO1]|uniref:linalool dehydratase/isomerase domain-containing protein n=1 Tax=Cryobacterium sp. SO1 TaxID=1897061 RepID=UPI0010236077|nr:hypothetical protein [Cryobacterium sp. SO1]RZI35244.1 hypothetical protein BJQ95_02310 [Cryobacterium sp. SO1]